MSEIIPVNTTRSIVKLDKKETKKIDRWNKILKEASEQSKRVVIPRVNEIMDIKDLTLKYKELANKLNIIGRSL